MVAESNIQAGGAGFKLSLQDELTKDLKSTLVGAVKTVQTVGAQIDREIKSIGRSIQSTGKQIAALGVGTAALGTGIAAGLAKATIAAGDFAETVNMFDAVFKDQSRAVRDWAQEYARQVGRSETQLMRFLAESQDTFVPLGFDRKEAAELSKTVTQLAVDLGSFKNIDDSDALRRLLGGIIGNTENLRAFGVVAQEAQIKAQALSMGFDPSNLTAYQKALAILEITVKGTADAQGDAIKTSDSFANSVRALKASFADLKNAIGAPLLNIATALVQGVTAVVEAIKDLVSAFPNLSRALAAAAVAMGAVGTAAAAMGAAIVLSGKAVAAAGVGVLLWTTRIRGAATALTLWTAAAKAAGSLSLFSGLSGAIGGSVIGGVIKGIKAAFMGLVRLVTGAAGTLAKALTGPWAALSLAVTAAMKTVEGYFRFQEHLGKKRATFLEQQRRENLGRIYRDMGQPGADVTQTLDPSRAFVVPGTDAEAAVAELTAAQRQLADEIEAFQTPLQRFRTNIEDASELLKRGEISQEQFDRYKSQQFQQFRDSDPAMQARVQVQQQRQSLIEQLKTPAERLKQSIQEARKLFQGDAKNFSRAVRSAVEQFRATDPVEQLRRQLMTPIERFQATVTEYRRLLSDQPELLRRAIAAARQEFRDSMPEPEEDPAKGAAENIREAIKSDAQKVAEKIAEATELVRRGLLNPSEAGEFARGLRDRFLGDNPASNQIQHLATRSAAVAGNLGSFAPGFDNTQSEEREYRRKAIELQRTTAEELKKIRRKKLVFS